MKISNSSIQAYKSCRRMYQIRYKFGYVPTSSTDAIERGLSYHGMLEQILTSGECEDSGNPKTDAMVYAFKMYILPHINPIGQEEWVRYITESGHEVFGRVDGINEDGCPIEHKTTSSSINESYWYDLVRNEQVLTYLACTGKQDIWYTVCRTPSIRQKVNETDDEFKKRCIEWYQVDTEQKIGIRKLHYDQDAINDFKSIQDATVSEIENCTLWFKCPSYCFHWGRMCEYAPICETCKPGENYIGFETK